MNQDIGMQTGTTPKQRTNLNWRAVLDLMRLDSARRSDQVTRDARVTKPFPPLQLRCC